MEISLTNVKTNFKDNKFNTITNVTVCNKVNQVNIKKKIK